jgi:hypothetical protein
VAANGQQARRELKMLAASSCRSIEDLMHEFITEGLAKGEQANA